MLCVGVPVDIHDARRSEATQRYFLRTTMRLLEKRAAHAALRGERRPGRGNPDGSAARGGSDALCRKTRVALPAEMDRNTQAARRERWLVIAAAERMPMRSPLPSVTSTYARSSAITRSAVA